MEQLKIFALVSLMYTSTVFLVHVHSSKYGGNNCSVIRCSFEVHFRTEGDVSCNKVVPEVTNCGYYWPRITWPTSKTNVEYLYVFADVGVGGPWYCPPNDVWHYNFITSAWFVRFRGIPDLMLTDNNVKDLEIMGRLDYTKYREHTFYVLLYHVRTYPKGSIYFTTLTEDIKAEMLRRAEAKANLSYTLAPYGLKHPDDLVGSHHFHYNYDTSCRKLPPPITAVPTTTVPSTTRSGSAARNNYAVMNAVVIFCTVLMANILFLYQ